METVWVHVLTTSQWPNSSDFTVLQAVSTNPLSISEGGKQTTTFGLWANVTPCRMVGITGLHMSLGELVCSLNWYNVHECYTVLPLHTVLGIDLHVSTLNRWSSLVQQICA